MRIQRPRGTRDFDRESMHKRKYIRNAIEGVFSSYGYSEISTPVFEYAELFKLKSGEGIENELYVFGDKSGRELCLRPENTAPICRMLYDKLNVEAMPIRYSYFAPMFRYDEPQKGRYREFWHAGVELIGSRSEDADTEVIMLAYDALTLLGLSFRLKIGYVGILKSILEWQGLDEKEQRKMLHAIDKKNMDVIKRMPAVEKLLDAKNVEDIGKIVEEHPAAKEGFENLKKILERLGRHNVRFELDLSIVRGLDYYTGMVFEIHAEELGGASQICGGGRYDNLIKLFCNADVPAVGFAFGFDRVIDAIEEQNVKIPENYIDIVIAPVNDEMREFALGIARTLRKNNIRVDYDVMNRKMRRILEYASEIGARYAVIVGPKESKENKIVLRDMKSGDQTILTAEEAIKILRR